MVVPEREVSHIYIFSISQSGGEGVFGITGAASEGFIVVTGELDYDTGPQLYTLNVSTMVSPGTRV